MKLTTQQSLMLSAPFVGCVCPNSETVALFSISTQLPFPYYPTSKQQNNTVIPQQAKELCLKSHTFSPGQICFSSLFPRQPYFFYFQVLQSGLTPAPFIFNLFSFPGHLKIGCGPFPGNSNEWRSLTNKSQRDRCVKGTGSQS